MKRALKNVQKEKKELEEAKKQSRQEWEAELAKAEAERDADYEKEVLAGTAGDSELGRRRKQREQLDVFKQTKMMATMAKLQQTKADFGEHMTQERELDDAVEQAKKAEEAKKKAEAEAKRLAEEAKQKQEKQAAARKAQEDSETAARDLVVKDEEKDRGIYQLKAMKAKSLITVTQEKADAITHLADLEEQRLEAQDKVEKLGHETRSKHNELEDLKGKIRVYVRTRPMKKGEAGGALEFPGGDMRSILLREGEGLRQKTYDYLFDRAFPGDTSQEEVFNETKGMCQSAMDGYNCCIFAYGQTGSGKTHTLVGTVDDPGIARRSMRHFFDLGAKLPPGQKLHMECSMMELYIDTFFDLLGKARAPLQVKQGAGGNFEMEGRTWADAPTYEALVALFAKGEGARSVRATSMNERSSRSHLIFTIRTKTKEGDATIRDGMFALVDLAGSERIKKSEVAAEGLREAVAINKSLSALGNVIEALSKVSRHIPYRDHQLTQAMQPFLKGNAKMLMFLAVSPASSSFQESKGSLTFAQRTKQVQLSNQEALKEVRAEIKIKEGELDSMMKDLHENARIAGESEIEAEDTRDQIEQFDDMIKDLYEELEQLQQDYPGY